jgi:hypothetical protein
VPYKFQRFAACVVMTPEPPAIHFEEKEENSKRMLLPERAPPEIRSF